MDKVLFLDHQGVMYTGKWPDKPTPIDFDSEAIVILNSILQIENLEIVISSDWKYWVNLEEMGNFYERQGIIKKPIGYTNTCPKESASIMECRSNEILDWLKENPTTKWCSVDDIDMRQHLSNFIWIEDAKLGIRTDDVKNKIMSYYSH